jgi:hypothetical protein
MIIAAITVILSFIKKLSFIPVMGMLSCFYLMTEIGLNNWIVFTIWLVAGLSVYFCYGYRKSRLSTPQ